MIVLCAVCEREIEESEALVVEFQGASYTVCSEQCRDEFEKNPEPYAGESDFEEVY